MHRAAFSPVKLGRHQSGDWRYWVSQAAFSQSKSWGSYAGGRFVESVMAGLG